MLKKYDFILFFQHYFLNIKLAKFVMNDFDQLCGFTCHDS